MIGGYGGSSSISISIFQRPLILSLIAGHSVLPQSPSEKSFYINNAILCRYSLLFRQLTREQNVISLPEVDEMSFAVFAEWLYLGEDCDTAEIMENALGEQEKGKTGNEE